MIDQGILANKSLLTNTSERSGGGTPFSEDLTMSPKEFILEKGRYNE